MSALPVLVPAGGGGVCVSVLRLVVRSVRIVTFIVVLMESTPVSMTCAQFNRFGRASGILELVGMKAPELEILFIRQCSAQKWTASAPAQKLMYHTTFTATLIEIAARAYPGVPHQHAAS